MDIVTVPLEVADYLAYRGLGLIPGYREKSDQILEEALYKIAEGQKLNFMDELKVGFQATSVKSSYLLPLLPAGMAAFYPHEYFLIMAGLGGAFAIVHNSAMGANLGKIYEAMPDEEKAELKNHLENREMGQIRDMLYEYIW